METTIIIEGMEDYEKEKCIKWYMEASDEEVSGMSDDEIATALEDVLEAVQNRDDYEEIIELLEEDNDEITLWDVIDEIIEQDDEDSMFPNGRDYDAEDFD